MASAHKREVVVFDYLCGAYPTIQEAAAAHSVGRASLQRWLKEYRVKHKIMRNSGPHKINVAYLRREYAK